MKNPLSNRRWQLVLAALVVAVSPAAAAQKTYRHFRFIPTKLRDQGQTLVQVSEFQFRLATFPVSLTGATATNSSGIPGDSPGGEQPANSIDLNTGTKWLNWNGAVPGPGIVARGIDFQFPAAVTIDDYAFYTANDAEGRDPVSWEFYGGLDDNDDGVVEQWVLLDYRIDHPTPTVRFALAGTFTLPEEPAPMLELFAAAPPVVLNGESVDLTWNVLYADAATIEIDQGVGAVAPSGFTSVTPPDDADTTYTLSAVSPGGVSTAATTVRTVAGGSANFRYYRFTQRKLRDGAVANSIQLAEFQFVNDYVLLDLTGVTASNPGGNFPALEGPTNLVDGSSATKWLDFNRAPVVFDFGVPTEIDAYAFTTANDAAERDPVRWILEGSDDAEAWVLIDTMTAFDFPVPTTRLATLADIPLPGDSLVPDIELFVGDAPALVAGQPLVLTWTTAGAASVTIDQGVGTVATAGSVTVNPTENTTYTLTATGLGRSFTAEFTTTIIDPAITTIAYDNFDAAGDELSLLGAAGLVNDSLVVPEPGDIVRLRLTPDEGGRNGTAWFRKRIDASDGFDTTFAVHLVSPTGGAGGADGMCFILQNAPAGNGATPVVNQEDGLPANALNVKFDSWMNPEFGDPSNAFVQVRAGTTVLATVDLTTVAGVTLSSTNDLTDRIGLSAPYPVRVAFNPGEPGSPGRLDVFFQGVRIIKGLPVDLGAAGAVDAAGTGYVGFSARTGGAYEDHDVTSWYLVEGRPILPPEIVDFSFDLGTNQVTLTFTSSDRAVYRVVESEDLTGFVDVPGGVDIPGAAGTGQTTTTVSFTPTKARFVRVALQE